MNTKNVLKSRALVVSTLFASAFAALPAVSHADLSGTFGVTSKYIWRGQSVSDAAPAVYGSVDYAHSSGIYVGSWTSSESVSGSFEIDAYGGYSGSIKDFGYDVGFAKYFYPQTETSRADDPSEFYVGLSYKPVSAKVYVNPVSNDMYMTLEGSLGKAGLHLGYTAFDSGDSYTDVALSYSLTENVSVLGSITDGLADNDPLVAISYTLPLDLSK